MTTADSAGVVVVGASVGGVRTAQTLRSLGFDGRVTLVSNEAVMPYDKPPLSKGFLTGAIEPDQMALLTEADAAELRIDVRLGCQARRLHPKDRHIELETGERIGYRWVVLATGASAKRPSTWPSSDRVHVLRTVSDARSLRDALTRIDHLAVIGAGFIGAEVAATARSTGLEVTMIDPNPAPMARIVGKHLGERFVGLHRRHGVRTRFGAMVRDLEPAGNHLRIALSDDTSVDADACVIGIGATPNDDWLASSGVRIDDGVRCDEFGRAVGAPGVFAVGDVARWHNPKRSRSARHEHWTNAHEQAQTVAHNIVHPDDMIMTDSVEYVWSDQYDWKIRIAGKIGIHPADTVEVISDDTNDRYALLSSADGTTLSGLVVVNWARALVVGRKALAEHASHANTRRAIRELLDAGSPDKPIAMRR